MSTSAAEHWDTVYATKATDEVSWFQRQPTTSQRLLTSVSSPSGAVIDSVADQGQRLGDTSRTVIVADVLDRPTTKRMGLWSLVSSKWRGAPWWLEARRAPWTTP